MTEVVSGEAVVLEVPCARFPSRLVALLIDMAIQVTVGLILLTVILATGTRLDVASTAAVALTAAVLIIVGYPAVFETVTRGRSPGKMALGLRVVSDDGGPERFRQALVRGLASTVEIWSFTGAPALICSLVSAKGKRLGDLFAGTFVIQERLPRRPSLPAALAVVPPSLAGWAQALELSGLQDQTAEQAGSYLRRFYELTPAARDEFGYRIAAAVAAQVTPAPPPGTPPAAYLSAVLAVRRVREAARLAAQQSAAAAQQGAAASRQGTATGQQAGTSTRQALLADRRAATPAAAAPDPGVTTTDPGLPGSAPSGQAPARPEPSGSGEFAPPV